LLNDAGMRKRTWLGVGFSMAVVAAGCATPAPVVRLEPRVAAQVIWWSGRAVLEQEQDGVRVAAAFEQQAGAGLGVRLEIENDTGAPFEVGPAGVTFMSCASADNATCSGSWNVVDPEKVLDGLDEQQSRAVADAANREALDTSLVLLSAVGEIGAAARGHDRGATGARTAALAGAAVADDARAGQSLTALADQREVWSNLVLRRSTLGPGRGVAGLVYLPVDPRAAYVWMHVRAGGRVFPFGFRLIVRQIVAPPPHTASGHGVAG
jgi:hypothetical protein